MINMRSGEVKPYTKFRSDRFFNESGQWYYLTREGTCEGPFQTHTEAELNLETYIKVVGSGLLGEAASLTLESNPSQHH